MTLGKYPCVICGRLSQGNPKYTIWKGNKLVYVNMENPIRCVSLCRGCRTKLNNLIKEVSK